MSCLSQEKRKRLLEDESKEDQRMEKELREQIKRKMLWLSSETRWLVARDYLQITNRANHSHLSYSSSDIKRHRRALETFAKLSDKLDSLNFISQGKYLVTNLYKEVSNLFESLEVLQLRLETGERRLMRHIISNNEEILEILGETKQQSEYKSFIDKALKGKAIPKELLDRIEDLLHKNKKLLNKKQLEIKNTSKAKAFLPYSTTNLSSYIKAIKKSKSRGCYEAHLAIRDYTLKLSMIVGSVKLLKLTLSNDVTTLIEAIIKEANTLQIELKNYAHKYDYKKINE